MRRRLVSVLVVLLGVLSLDGSRRSHAQVIDCYYMCWTFPCYFYCAAAIRAIYPKPLIVPVPNDDMWEQPETVVILN